MSKTNAKELIFVKVWRWNTFLPHEHANFYSKYGNLISVAENGYASLLKGERGPHGVCWKNAKMIRSLAALTCPVLVLAVLLCEAREMSRGTAGRRSQHLRENELHSQEQGLLWSHEYAVNDGPSPLASSSSHVVRHRRTQPRAFDTFHTPPLPSSSSSNSPFSSLSFSFNTSSREDYSLEEKCSHEQFRDTVKKQKDYIDNYLTQSYNDSRENITIGFLSSFTYNKVGSFVFFVFFLVYQYDYIMERCLWFFYVTPWGV